jgi:hypothetical protein
VPEDVGVIVDGRLAEVNRSTAGFVQQPVHGGKCPSRVERVRRESPIGWQAVVETPCKEDRLVNLMEESGEVAAGKASYLSSGKSPRNSQTTASRPGGRLRTWGSAPPTSESASLLLMSHTQSSGASG